MQPVEGSHHCFQNWLCTNSKDIRYVLIVLNCIKFDKLPCVMRYLFLILLILLKFLTSTGSNWAKDMLKATAVVLYCQKMFVNEMQ